MPIPGAVEDGFQFVGGDPADPAAWRPVSPAPPPVQAMPMAPAPVGMPAMGAMMPTPAPIPGPTPGATDRDAEGNVWQYRGGPPGNPDSWDRITRRAPEWGDLNLYDQFAGMTAQYLGAPVQSVGNRLVERFAGPASTEALQAPGSTWNPFDYDDRAALRIGQAMSRVGAGVAESGRRDLAEARQGVDQQDLTFLQRGAQGATTAITPLLVGLLTRNPAAATLIAGGMAGTAEESSRLAEGYTPEEAVRAGVLEGGLESLTELPTYSFAMAKSMNPMTRMLGAVLSETVGEQFATASQGAASAMIGQPSNQPAAPGEFRKDKTIGEFFSEDWLPQAYDTLATTTFMAPLSALGGLAAVPPAADNARSGNRAPGASSPPLDAPGPADSAGDPASAGASPSPAGDSPPADLFSSSPQQPAPTPQEKAIQRYRAFMRDLQGAAILDGSRDAAELQSIIRELQAAGVDPDSLSTQPDPVATAPDPAAPESPPPAPGAPPPTMTPGAGAVAYTPRGDAVPVQYALAEADQLIASNDDAGNVNPAYPAELQPRDRTRATSGQQVARIANDLNPELLGPSPTITDGAPIVGPDGVVESGNARVMGVRRAYRVATGERMRQWLTANAAALGLDPTQIAAMRNPMLVRVRQGETNRAEFARQANERNNAQMSGAEQARADAARIELDDLQMFAPDESGNILTGANRGFISRFLAKIGAEQAAGLLDAAGQPTRQLVDRITSAIFNKVYNDDRLTALQAEAADPDIRNVLNALLQAAPAFARARSFSEDYGGSGVTDVISEAVDLIRQAKRTGVPVEAQLQQAGMFSQVNPLAGNLALFMARNMRSAKRMAGGLRELAQGLESNAVSQVQGSLLDGAERTLGEIIDGATQEQAPQQGDLLTARRGDEAGGRPQFAAPELQDTADALVGSLQGDLQPRVVVVQRREDLPPDTNLPPVKAMYRRSSEGSPVVYVVADKVTSIEEFIRSLAHEIVGHHGLNALLPQQELWTLLGEVYAALEQRRPKGWAEIKRRYQDFPAEIQAEEYLAWVAERGLDMDSPVMDRVIVAVARALRQLGQALGVELQLTRAEIRDIVAQSRRYLNTGQQQRLTRERAPGATRGPGGLAQPPARAPAAVAPTDREQRGYHGSAAKFDQLDPAFVSDNLGTNRHGWGFYLTPSPDYAGDFAEAGAWDPGAAMDEQDRSVSARADRVREQLQGQLPDRPAKGFDRVYAAIVQAGGDVDAAVRRTIRQHRVPAVTQQQLRELARAVPSVDLDDRPAPTGYLYRVEIADPAFETFADWDRPLSDTPAALEALRSSEAWGYLERELGDVASLTGAQLYGALSEAYNPPGASAFLSRAGVKGMVAEGGQAYVAYDAADLTVERRDEVVPGQPIPGGRPAPADTGAPDPDVRYQLSAAELEQDLAVPARHPLLVETIDKPGREPMREAIVRQHLAGKPRREQPSVWLMGGGGASGKGTVKHALIAAGRLNPQESVTVDPDEIKGLLPEYNSLVSLSDPRAASVVHEESALIGDEIVQRAVDGRHDVILDKTLANPDKGEALIRRFLDAGYEVRMIGVTIPTDEAWARSRKRFENSGRYVPEQPLREAHAGFAAAWPRYAALLPEADLYDNTGKTPELIATVQDGELQIVNDELYRKFEAKANEPTEATTPLPVGRDPAAVRGRAPGARRGGGRPQAQGDARGPGAPAQRAPRSGEVIPAGDRFQRGSRFAPETERLPGDGRMVNIDAVPAHARLLADLGNDWAIDNDGTNPVQVSPAPGGRSRVRVDGADVDSLIDYVEQYAFETDRDPLPANFARTIKALKDAAFQPTRLDPGDRFSRGEAPPVRSRREAQQALRELGIPGTGTTEKLQQLARIADTDPAQWTEADLDAIAPHVFIHQDLKGQTDPAVIEREGITKGQFDPLDGVMGRGYSWVRGMAGGRAYLAWPADIEYRGKGNPWVKRARPFFTFEAAQGQAVPEALGSGQQLARGGDTAGDRFQAAPPVASAAFRRWFKQSAVTDAAGDPLEVWHGSPRRFTKFVQGAMGWARRGIWFAKDQAAAMGYAGERGPIKEWAPAFDPELLRRDPVAALAGLEDFEVTDNGDGTYSVDDGMDLYEGTAAEIADQLGPELDQIDQMANNPEMSEDNLLYPVYLSLQNPLEIDYQGRLWSDPPPAVVDAVRAELGVDIRGEQYDHPTNDIAEAAEAAGYDGVIFRNIVDQGWRTQAPAPSQTPVTDVFVAFDSAQVKSSRSNTGAFDPANPDIRYLIHQPVPGTGGKTVKQVYGEVVDRVMDRVNSVFDPFHGLADREQFLGLRYKALGEIQAARKAAAHIKQALMYLDPDTKQEVFDFLTAPGADPMSIRNVDARREAKAAKQAIHDISDKLVNKGLISIESRDKYRDRYLPRVYLKYLLEEKSYAALGTGRKPGQMGWRKHRDESIPEEIREVLLGEVKNPGFLAASAIATPARDMALLDWLESISLNQDWALPQATVQWNGHRVTPYWLIKEAERLRRMAASMDQDRTVTSGTVTYNPADAARTLATQMETTGQAAIAALTGGQVDLSQYKQIPDNYRYGRLRGLWVRSEIHDDIIGVNAMTPDSMGMVQSLLGYGGIGTKLTQFWKGTKVGLNPPAQIRNAVSNVVLINLSGVPWRSMGRILGQAIREVRDGGPHRDIVDEYGVLEGTFANVEMLRATKEITELQEAEGMLSVMGKLMHWLRKGYDGAGDLYQLIEAVGKTAIIIHQKEQGATDRDAVLHAQEWLFDYSLVPQGIRVARGLPYAAPFVTFQYKVLPRMIETMLKHPQRFLPYAALFYGVQYAVAEMLDVDDDDIEALKKALPKWLQDRGHVMFIPLKDDRGRWQFLDLGYFMPWSMWTELGKAVAKGNVSDAASTAGIISGPLYSAAAGITMNRDPFTDRQIVFPDDPPKKQLLDLMNYAWTIAGPPFLTEYGATGHALRAYRGQVDRYGDPASSYFNAALRMVGLNMYPVEPEMSRSANLQQLQRELGDIQRRMKYDIRRESDPARQDRIIEDYSGAIDRKAEQIGEYEESSRINPRLR